LRLGEPLRGANSQHASIGQTRWSPGSARPTGRPGTAAAHRACWRGSGQLPAARSRMRQPGTSAIV
jgi:hypothetical protein